MKYFDPIEYVKNLRNVGVAQEVAEVQAQEMEHVVNNLLNNESASTKADLREMELRLRYDTLRFTVWTGVGVVVGLGGLLGRGFHWW